MWNTPKGDRAIIGLEADVARIGLEAAVEFIVSEMDHGVRWQFGVGQFDALTPSQRLALLADVGKSLFSEEVAPPKQTAINEAAVYVIFRALLTAVEIEIDNEDANETEVRQAICNYCAQDEYQEDDDDDAPLSPECRDVAKWEFEIECLADRILWDRDFELSDLIVDTRPEKASFLKAHLGIDKDYYTAIAADPMDLDTVRSTLNELARRKPR